MYAKKREIAAKEKEVEFEGHTFFGGEALPYRSFGSVFLVPNILDGVQKKCKHGICLLCPEKLRHSGKGGLFVFCHHRDAFSY